MKPISTTQKYIDNSTNELIPRRLDISHNIFHSISSMQNIASARHIGPLVSRAANIDREPRFVTAGIRVPVACIVDSRPINDSYRTLNLISGGLHIE